jgi:hypothetical protein
VLSCVGRGLCDGLITRPVDSFRASNSVSLRNRKGAGQGPIWALDPLDGWISAQVSLIMYATINIKTFYFELHLDLLDVLILINVLKVKPVAPLLWIFSVCACPLGQSETTRHMCIVTSRLFPQPDVFLLPIQSVGTFASNKLLQFTVLCLALYLCVKTLNAHRHKSYTVDSRWFSTFSI